MERLAEVGFAKCTGDIMPSNPTWRGSLQQWKRRLMAIVRYEYEEYAKNLMDLIVLSDARFVAGDAATAAELIEMIRDFEQSYFQVIWGMARQATEMKVGVSMFGQIWTDREGEHRGLFNVKLLGWAPLVMNIRILAVNSGSRRPTPCSGSPCWKPDKRLSPSQCRRAGRGLPSSDQPADSAADPLPARRSEEHLLSRPDGPRSPTNRMRCAGPWSASRICRKSSAPTFRRCSGRETIMSTAGTTQRHCWPAIFSLEGAMAAFGLYSLGSGLWHGDLMPVFWGVTILVGLASC